MFNKKDIWRILEGLLLGILFWIWSTSYFWTNMGLDLIARLTEIILVFLVFIAFLYLPKYKRLMFNWIPFGLYFTIILLIWFITDYDHPYKVMLYIKTFFYVLVSPLIGVLIVSIICGDSLREKTFSKVLVVASSLLVLGYFIFAIIKGWDVRSSILSTELGKLYQGIGRLMAFSVLTFVGLRYYTGYKPLIFIAPLATLIILSYKSIAALVGLLYGFTWLIFYPEYTSKNSNKVNYNWKTVFSVIMVLCLISFVFISFSNGAIERIGSKIKGDENRIILMYDGLRLWLTSVKTFLFGPGILSYACYLDYCEHGEYRHPHNLFVLILVWFGLFGLPFFIIILWMIKAGLVGVFCKSAIYRYFSLLLFFYFFLAMIGGDLEQNRHFFAVGGAVVALRKLIIDSTK